MFVRRTNTSQMSPWWDQKSDPQGSAMCERTRGNSRKVRVTYPRHGDYKETIEQERSVQYRDWTKEDATFSSRTKMSQGQKPTTGDDLMKFMVDFRDTMEKKIEAVSGEIDVKLEGKMKTINDGMIDIIKEVKSNDKKQAAASMELARRIDLMEVDMKRIKFSRMRSDSLHDKGDGEKMNGRRRTETQKTKDRMNDRHVEEVSDKEVEVENEDYEPMRKEKSWAEEMEEEIRNGGRENPLRNDDKEQWTNKVRKPSSWATELNGEIKLAAEKTGRMEKVTRKMIREEKAVKRLEEHACKRTAVNTPKHWFGDSEDSSEDTSEDDDTWNKVSREEKNREKKRRNRIRKSEKKAEVSKKARNMAGLGPITNKEIEEQRAAVGGDYELAKIKAAKEHLSYYYRYNKEELEDLEILETKRTNKDEILYIAVRDQRDIGDIYARKAECQQDETIVKNYIPPQFFARFSALNELCKDRRQEDDSLKTQLRFGDRDIEVLTKEKGSEDPFRVTKLQEFIGDRTVPEFDFSLKWRAQNDRPPRRRVTSNGGGSDKEDRQNQRPVKGKDWTRRPTETNRITRQHSIEVEEVRNKRSKRGTTEDNLEKDIEYIMNETTDATAKQNENEMNDETL